MMVNGNAARASCEETFFMLGFAQDRARPAEARLKRATQAIARQNVLAANDLSYARA